MAASAITHHRCCQPCPGLGLWPPHGGLHALPAPASRGRAASWTAAKGICTPEKADAANPLVLVCDLQSVAQLTPGGGLGLEAAPRGQSRHVPEAGTGRWPGWGVRGQDSERRGLRAPGGWGRSSGRGLQGSGAQGGPTVRQAWAELRPHGPCPGEPWTVIKQRHPLVGCPVQKPEWLGQQPRPPSAAQAPPSPGSWGHGCLRPPPSLPGGGPPPAPSIPWKAAVTFNALRTAVG